MSSIVSTPIQRYRKHPKLIKELEACKTRKWWPEVESNHRHEDFQSSALPTELSGQIRKRRIKQGVAEAVKQTTPLAGGQSDRASCDIPLPPRANPRTPAPNVLKRPPRLDYRE